jgi:hypothetical protein
MINRFKKRKRNRSATRYLTLRILLKRFQDRCNETQIRIARSLQVSFERLSSWAKYASVLFFLLLCMSTFTYIISSSIKIRSPVDIEKYRIKFPRVQIVTKVRKDLPIDHLQKDDQKRITQFRKYMDSLSQSKSGSMLRDSILKVRPGIMDSITRLENVLNSNKLKVR